MIKFLCPRCRAKIKAEDEVMGKEITCTKCRHRFPVGVTADAAEARKNARILEAQQSAKKNRSQATPQIPDTQGEATAPPITKTPSAFRKWVTAHPLASAGITGTIMLVFFASIAATYFTWGGKFPSRPRLERTLATRGFHKTAAIPSIGVLRGRSLRKYRYALDANYPEAMGIEIWCALDNDKLTKGLTAQWTRDYPDKDKARWQKLAVEHFIEDLADIRPRKIMLYKGKDGLYRGGENKGGYYLELIGEMGYGEDKDRFAYITYILRDKTWNE